MRPRLPTPALALLALAGSAAGQPAEPDGGPVVVGTPRETWKSVELTHLDAAIEFRWQYQEDKINQAGQPSQKFTESRFRESLDLNGEIIVGHKNLLDITGAVSLGLEDIFTKNTADGTDAHESDLDSFYDLSALVFGASELPTTVFARRTQSLLDRPFAPTITETVMEEGILTKYQTSRVSSNIGYSHRDQTLKGNAAGVDSRVTQDTLNLQGVITLAQNQRLEAVYTLDQIAESQSGAPSDNYTRHDGNIVHDYTFGDELRPHDLRSSLRFYDQDGRQARSDVRWDEALTLHHSDRLETRYNTVVDTQTIRGQEQSLARADASIRHRLFESLTSTATAGGQHLSAPGDATTDELFANGALDYTKRVPLGRLDAAVGAGYNAQSNSEHGQTLAVAGESYTYHDGLAVIIPRRNIVPGSVVVTPLAGFPVYIEGTDYTLDIFPDHAELRGVVGGALIDGQTILLAYDVGPEPGSDINTATATFSARYTIAEGFLDGLAVYATYRTVSHTVSAKDPTLFRLDDVNDLLLGLEYRYAEFTGRYEFNDHDSTFNPYQLHRLQGLYNLPLGLNSSLSAELTRELIDYATTGETVTFDRGSLRWNHRLNTDLDLTARLEYRREDSSVGGTSTGLDESLGLTYHRRQTTIYGNLRNSNLDGPASSQSSQYLQFGVRRTF